LTTTTLLVRRAVYRRVQQYYDGMVHYVQYHTTSREVLIINKKYEDVFYAFSSKYDDYGTVVMTDLEWTKESTSLSVHKAAHKPRELDTNTYDSTKHSHPQ
jgi:hypothetical protein